MNPPDTRLIFTVGHSNKTSDAFIELLIAHGIEQIVDVRRFPGSRRFPHFGSTALADSLAVQAIGYVHMPALGGRRGRPVANSPNNGWRVAQFAAYADYMQTLEFKQAIADLEQVAVSCRSAIMCAEAVPWRCHRRLIADALIVAGWQVRDIMDARKAPRPHALTPFARQRGGELIYPAAPSASGSQ